MARQSCYWVFTANNPTAPLTCPEGVAFLVYQRELAPSTGTPHFQGYLECATRQRSTAVMKMLKKAGYTQKAFVEPRKGTAQQAYDYATDRTKPGVVLSEEPVVHGVFAPTSPGERTDILDLRDAALLAPSLSSLLSQDSIQTCLAGHLRYASLCVQEGARKRTRPFRTVEVIVRYGPTGTGKTRMPYELPEEPYKWNPNNPEWWDGYSGQSIIIIDEYYGQLKPSRLLQLLDGYQCMLPVKGSFTYAEWTTVYITSNAHPSKWYKDLPEEVQAAINRRITLTEEIGGMSSFFSLRGPSTPKDAFGSI